MVNARPTQPKASRVVGSVDGLILSVQSNEVLGPVWVFADSNELVVGVRHGPGGIVFGVFGSIILGERLRMIWERREDRYSEIRGELGPAKEKVEMYRIGG